MKRSHAVILVVALIGVSVTARTRAVGAGLPDPFVFLDGSRVQSAADWSRRRIELKHVFEEYVYGTLPPTPGRMVVRRSTKRLNKDAGFSLGNMTVRLEAMGRSMEMHVAVAVPVGDKRRLPVVICGAVPRIPGIPRDSLTLARNQAYTSRGYAVAEIDLNDIAVDDKPRGRTGGIYLLYGDTISCGTLMAWAWGFHRVVDLVTGLPYIDSGKVIVTGHSRYGKAALIAGAFDERIALTVPSHSGCAGVAPFRLIYGKAERLQNITGFAPHWFRRGFGEFAGKENELPVDQHMLVALVAPRGLFGSEGTLDAWTNPEGSQVSYRAAAAVYRFLGAAEKETFRYRPVGHIPSSDDLIDFADHLFFGKPLPEEFGKMPYPPKESLMRWSDAETHGEEWPSGTSPREIGRRVAMRLLQKPLASGRGEPADHVTYPETCTWYGALEYARLAGDTLLQNALVHRFDSLFHERRDLLPVPDHVDYTVFAAVPLELYILTQDRRYLDIGREMADKQWGEPFGPRANEESWDYYRRGFTWQTRLWIDDMFMITAAQVQAYRATGERKYIDRAAREMVMYLDSLQKPNGLFYHAPDVPFFWGRGNGWVASGLTEVLRSLPADNADRPRILASYRAMMGSLLKYQDENGMWHQLIDKPDAWPEASCSAMFTFAMITGVKSGWLSGEEYSRAARKGWHAVISYINDYADISEVCEGTGKKNDEQYYLDRKRNVGDMHGQAPVLWCAAAWLR